MVCGFSPCFAQDPASQKPASPNPAGQPEAGRLGSGSKGLRHLPIQGDGLNEFTGRISQHQNRHKDGAAHQADDRVDSGRLDEEQQPAETA